MVNIQSPTAEIRRGKKKKERKKDRNRMKIYMVSLLHRPTINYRMKILWSALLHRATIIKLPEIIDNHTGVATLNKLCSLQIKTFRKFIK